MRILRISFIFFLLCPLASPLLYPQQNEHRNLLSLDGLWTFVREPSSACFTCPSVGELNQWYAEDLMKFANATKMPVPSAYNELTPDARLREHVGWVWYQRLVRVPAVGKNEKRILRFGSVQYKAVVYVNGEKLAVHLGGHLPFDVELPASNSTELRITVAVDNTLHSGTIPPGTVVVDRRGNVTQIWNEPGFDFFNYAGILRSVVLQTVHRLHVRELRVWTEKPNRVHYNVTISETKAGVKVGVCLFDPSGRLVQCVSSPNFFAPLETAELWWPRGYGNQSLYSLEVTVYVDTRPVDVYREMFGFRWVELKGGQVFVNDRHVYCQGFGMHEEFHLHGRGYDPVVMIRDLNMLEWMNGNCYRTSHYPYDEERAYETDRRGIVVITEVPAVGIWNFNKQTLALHEQMIEETINRDFNHPSVIAWSLTNEPHTSDKPECLDYFEAITSTARRLDATRPIAGVFGTENPLGSPLKAAAFFDLLGLNVYIGWYNQLDEMDGITNYVADVIRSWRRLMNRTILVTEYGAEGLPGFYAQPSIVFSEQYQEAVIQRNHEAFDRLIHERVLAGEMIWNFADFMTSASLTRPFGNHKGVLTRERQPKHAASLLRRRYARLKGGVDGFEQKVGTCQL